MAGEKRARNAEIVQLVLQGEPVTEVARAYGLHHTRIRQIVNAYWTRRPLDIQAGRAQTVARLEELYHTLRDQALSGSSRATALAERVLLTQARIAGFIAPTKVQVQSVDPLFTPEDFATGLVADQPGEGPVEGTLAPGSPPEPGESILDEPLPRSDQETRVDLAGQARQESLR